MNEVFGQLGEYNHIKQEDDNNTRVPCLAACEDQINQISISQSALPNAWVDWRGVKLRQNLIYNISAYFGEI